VKPLRRRHLPSLGALATFEIAAKHLSFTLAARELNITQGAVSQQIRLLERALGTGSGQFGFGKDALAGGE
jgi:Bacterial regulatory helix-turn-helix protein, lysR family